MTSSVVCRVVALAVAVVSSARADYVPVHGGPNSIFPEQAANWFKASGIEAGDGFAIGHGNTQVIRNGMVRAIAWGVNSSTVMQTLGPSGAMTNGDTTRVNVGNGTSFGSSTKIVNGQNVGERPVRWNANGDIFELAYAGPSGSSVFSSVSDANTSGVAVGYIDVWANNGNVIGSSISSSALRWTDGGDTVQELGNLGTSSAGIASASALAVNATGLTVGGSTKYNNGVSMGGRPVFWRADSNVAEEFAMPALATSGGATGITDNGTAYGVAIFANSFNSAAVRWTTNPSDVTVLDGLTTATNGYYGYNRIYAMNESGTAIGVATADGTSTSPTRAVRWNSDSTAITVLGFLGTPPSNINTYAFDINSSGLTVGMQRMGNGGGSAFGTAVVWNADGVAIDLNTFIDPASGWTLVEADSISDTNWVAGVGRFDPDGAGPLTAYSRAFLIQIPEPALMAFGAFAALSVGRRRRR